MCVLAGRFQPIALNAEPDPFGGLAPTTLPHSAASTMCEELAAMFDMVTDRL